MRRKWKYTFNQVSLELIELTLSQTNVQVERVVLRNTASFGPLLGYVMSFLDGVGRARTKRCCQNTMGRNGQRKHSCNTNHLSYLSGEDGEVLLFWVEEMRSYLSWCAQGEVTAITEP